MEEMVNIKFRLASIIDETLSMNIEGVDFSLLDENKLKYQYKVDTEITPSKNVINVIPSIRYSYEDRELMIASAVFNYSFINLESAIDVDRENMKINVKADIFPSLVGAAYNSLRGIVYVRTLGTALSKYPMPMIDVKTLVEKSGISVE